MHNGPTLILYDVFFASDIRRNLIFIVVLLRFGFTLNIYSTSITLYLNDVYYGYGYISNCFIILNVIYIMTFYNTHFSIITSAVDENIDVNVLYMRLCHIGQQIIDRLAKKTC
jgi:hypothetical protein